MSSATAILVPLFAVVVLFAILAVVRLGRGWRAADGVLETVDPEILALEDEKQRILATLRDLDQEHALGKLSDADHQGLRRHFEHEAMRVIGRLDELGVSKDDE